MKLIWTLNFNIESNDVIRENRKILINFYVKSITTAKQLGYVTIIYTNESNRHVFDSLVDEFIPLESYCDSILFDSFKIKVLEERTDDFYLIDGDLILNSVLPVFDVDVTFDSYEISHWKMAYGDSINELMGLGINEIFPDFSSKTIKILGCGLLRIPNLKNRLDYVDNWKKFSIFINNNITQIKNNPTAVGAQYLLTMLIKNNGLSVKPLSEVLGQQNEFYKHYIGQSKYNINDSNGHSKKLF
jgi:hypothetical protein